VSEDLVRWVRGKPIVCMLLAQHTGICEVYCLSVVVLVPQCELQSFLHSSNFCVCVKYKVNGCCEKTRFTRKGGTQFVHAKSNMEDDCYLFAYIFSFLCRNLGITKKT